MTYVPNTWPKGMTPVERNDLLASLRKHLISHKKKRRLTYGQIAAEAGCTTVAVSNATNWQATYSTYKKLSAWVNAQPN